MNVRGPHVAQDVYSTVIWMGWIEETVPLLVTGLNPTDLNGRVWGPELEK